MRTYSGALANFRNNTIDYRPLRMQPTETDVTVKTVVNLPTVRVSPSTTRWKRVPTASGAPATWS